MVEKLTLQEILKTLQLRFPGAFPKKEVRILKKDIDLDIFNTCGLKISRTQLKTFLKVYTAHSLYVKAHTVGANRYNLRGLVVGKVSKEECLSMTLLRELRFNQKTK